MYGLRFILTFLLLTDVTITINTTMCLAENAARRLRSFVDVEHGISYHSILYELLSREPEDENLAHPVTKAVDGDMLLTGEQIQMFYEKETMAKRKIIANKQMLWPKHIVPWMFNTKERRFQRPESRIAVLKAIKHWEDRTCLKFVEFESEDYKSMDLKPDAILSFGTGNGCASPVGYSKGVQNVYLDERTCTQVGTIIHEIGHVIGFFHEQARADRDSHVTILRANIRHETRFNFHVTEGLSNSADYDLGSIMHYGPKYFSKNGRNTIIPRRPLLEFLMGQRDKMSFYDIQEVNAAYKCAAGCRDKPSCENGGFLVKSCHCFCPEGLSGARCQQIDDRLSTGEGDIFLLTYGASKLITSSGQNLHTSMIWVVKSPKNTTMTLNFVLDLVRDPHAHVCFHWVEIRYNFIGQPGPRFCGRSSVPVQLISSNNLIMVRYNSLNTRYMPGHGFYLNVSVEHPVDKSVLCTFKALDMNTCPFYQNSQGSAHWSFYELNTESTGYHKEDSDYIYIDFFSGSKGSKAILKSAEIKGGLWCLRFLYFIIGTKTYRHFVVFAMTTDSRGIWRLWDSFGHIGLEWKMVAISLHSIKPFVIQFEAEVRRYLTIALGRIELDIGQCKQPDRSLELKHANATP